MKLKSIREIKVNGKRILMRVDFNVPVKNGKISDDSRIKKALPTIKYLLDNEAKIILMTHFGNPKPENKHNFKVDLIAKRLSELLNKPVKKLDDCIGESVKNEVSSMKNGDIILLENTRFYKEEKKNDPEFSKKLAESGEIYVNDAFGTAHRAHASTAGVAEYLPAYAGFLMEKEIKALSFATHNPEKPYYAILGGAKVSSKIPVIENLLPKVDKLIISGGMVFTFLKAKNVSIGNSLLEENYIELCKKYIENFKEKLIFPVDYVIAKEVSENSEIKISENIPEAYKGLDIGPKSLSLFKEELKNGKTIVWNGPMGVFEIPEFAKGTFELAKFLSELKDAKVIIGGGDSAAAIKEIGLEDKIYHVSTGGGASLEFLEGKTLPGIKPLLKED